ncbi:MAG: hypothetical protein QOK07_3422, partial [Gemmatimonadaceae bacterium]|nr:hypothetical protein [Gemmatimonadaceae bacterium]
MFGASKVGWCAGAPQHLFWLDGPKCLQSSLLRNSL